MRLRIAVITTALAGAALSLCTRDSGAIDTIYNMAPLLRQPHPFDQVYVPPAAPKPVGPTVVPPPPLPAPASAPAPAPRRTVAEPVSAAPAPAPVAAPARPPAAPVPERRAQPQQVEKAQATPSDERRPLWGVISEIRGGALIHDEGPFSHRKEEGYDVNLEFLFVSPKFLEIIWSPRPHIGFDINTSSDTSQVYAGLSYEWEFWGGVFAGFSLGGAVHNGKTSGDHTDRKDLGCPVLFRESVEIGYRFAGTHSVSLMLDHISNAKLCDHNEGLENFGIRYGYKF